MISRSPSRKIWVVRRWYPTALMLNCRWAGHCPCRSRAASPVAQWPVGWQARAIRQPHGKKVVAALVALQQGVPVGGNTVAVSEADFQRGVGHGLTLGIAHSATYIPSEAESICRDIRAQVMHHGLMCRWLIELDRFSATRFFALVLGEHQGRQAQHLGQYRSSRRSVPPTVPSSPRNSMPRCHSASLSFTSLANACRCWTRRVNISRRRTSVAPL